MRRLVAVPLLMLPLMLAASWISDPQPSAPAFDFGLQILPLLQRQGCSSAYCHGSAKGRGGFKLSLFGGDPRADYRAITSELEGRRIDLLHPEQSLVLSKPSLAMLHGGGRRLAKGSAAYARLREWIADGAPWARGEQAVARGLRLEHTATGVRAFASVAIGDCPQSWRPQSWDVTDATVFTSTDERVATVDEDGAVHITGRGEAWILGRWAHQDARLLVPEHMAAPAASQAQPIDALWQRHLAALGLHAAHAADSWTLARRLWLDLAGRPPTVAEALAFSKLPRERAVATTATKLLRAPEFARVFASHLEQWLELDASWHAPLVQALQRGDSLVDIARRLLTTSGPIERLRDAPSRAEYVGRAFLGVRIGCARCHDHPGDRWRQDDHLAFAAYFADPRPDGGGHMASGVLFDPRTGDPVTPRLLPAGTKQPPAGLGRREQVAWFVLDDDHGMFARNIVNRVFAALLGEGLVEPLDDHRLANPARDEALLAALAEHFTERQGDLRGLVELIVDSRLYALSSEPRAGEDADLDVRWLARRQARAMPADLLRASIAQVLGRPLAGDIPKAPLARQLTLLNGDALRGALERGGTLVDAIADLGGAPGDRLERLWLLILSRPPSSAERQEFATILEPAGRAGMRDLAFALLASREFGSIR